MAPGRLGASAETAAGVFAAALVAGALVGLRLRASRWCARCGRRVCPRCDPEVSRGDLCGACNQLYYQPEHTDRYLRTARIEALRERALRLDRVAWAVSVAVPGAAGALARRPLLSVWGAIWFVGAGAVFASGDRAVPDPLVAGAAGPFAFVCIAVFASLGYVLAVALALAARRRL